MGLCYDYVPQKTEIQHSTTQKSILEEILGDGFLFAVPKHRRSIEKRLKRKYGDPEHHMKILIPRKNLRTCNVCGDDYEIGVLCRKILVEFIQL